MPAPAALSQYLFGSLTTVTDGDLSLVARAGRGGPGARRSAWPRSCSRSAPTRSSPAPRDCGSGSYNVLIVVLAAITVTLAMRTVGLLLVSALMVVPVAAARNLVRGFYAALVCAMVVGVFVSVGGAVGVVLRRHRARRA